MFKIHPFENVKTTNWSGGKTSELIIFPSDSDFQKRDFEFRMSIASIETETSNFTSLPSYQRCISTLEGNLEIIHENKYSKMLNPFEFEFFHGSWSTKSIGKVRDFNVIYSENYDLNIKYQILQNNLTLERKSSHLMLLVLNESFQMENTNLKKYDLIEVLDQQIDLSNGLIYIQIELNKS